MNFDLKVNPDGLAYRQIVDYFRLQIALGKLKPDERLPAIRHLARTLTLDPGTVARAYRELEKEGTIVTRQGKGSYVATPTSNTNEIRRKRLGVIAEKAILEALGLGFSVEDIQTALTLHLSGWRQSRFAGDQKVITQKSKNVEIRFAGSHDLAVELLSVHLGTLNPGIVLSTNFIGSLPGLMALEREEADIAGAHLYDEESGQYNVAYAKKLIPNEDLVLINLVQRIQGLIIRPGNPKQILGIHDLARPEITFINRQKGSGTRISLDAQLRQHDINATKINGYDREEVTHSAVAGAIARGEADVGLGAQSAASASGLDFIPLIKERYDLIVLRKNIDNPGMQNILTAIRQDNFLEMLRSIPGYDLSDTGNIKTVST